MSGQRVRSLPPNSALGRPGIGAPSGCSGPAGSRPIPRDLAPIQRRSAGN